MEDWLEEFISPCILGLKNAVLNHLDFDFLS